MSICRRTSFINSLVLSLSLFIFGYASADTDFERDKRLFIGSVIHLEDALLLAKEISNGKKELIPLYQDKVEEAVRLSGLMKNAYLNHFDSNLKHVYTRYINSFVLVSRFYKDELNDSEVAELNDKFYAAQMEFIRHTELYPDLLVLEEDESVIAVNPKKSRWWLFLWILLKSVLFVFPLAFVLSICSGLQFLFLTVLKRLSRFLLPIYVTLISFSVLNLPFALLYALTGAYYYEIKVLFSEMVLSSWVGHIVSIAGIVLCISSIGGESKRAQRDYVEGNKKNGDPDEIYFSAGQLSNISIITSTNGVWLIAVSYILCLVFPFLTENYFAGVPEFLAELWIK